MFDGTYQTMAQIFIGVSIIPVWFMLKNGRNKTEPHSALWKMLLFGLLSIVITLAISTPLQIFFPEIGLILDGQAGSKPPDSLLLATFIYAAIEELAKFIPAAFFLYKKPYFNWRSDGILYFGLIGLTFGFIENMLYTATGGAAVGIVRIVFGLFFHGAVTAIAGYGLSYKKVSGRSWLFVVFALVIATGFHVLYNFGLFLGQWQPTTILVSIAVTIVVNINFFVMFWLANKKDISQFGIAAASTVVANTPAVSSISTQQAQIHVIHARQASPLSVTTLILGIIAIFSWIIPLFGLIPSVIAIILGLSMLSKDPDGKSYNVAGAILGGIGLLLSILVHIFIVFLIAVGSAS